MDSIVNQTYRDLEILIIDDGSTDGSGKICDEYKEKDSRIRVFHTENRGLSAARNRGLDEATGEYIGFVDSDDWIEFDMYENLMKRISDADIAVCGYTWEGASESYKSFSIDRLIKYRTQEALIALINEKINSNVWNKLYHCTLFSSIRFPEGHNYEDAAIMHIIVAQAKESQLIPIIEYHRRYREGSITRTPTASNLIDRVEANISRLKYFEIMQPGIYKEYKNHLLYGCACSISNLWCLWYGVSYEERLRYNAWIEELSLFNRMNLSPFLQGRYLLKRRVIMLFLWLNNRLVFFTLYKANQLYNRIINRKRKESSHEQV